MFTFFNRERLTIDLTTMEPHKSRSMDSLDELGSENDFEVITGNYEELTTADGERLIYTFQQSHFLS